MVPVTRLDGRQLVVNAELIETLEATPDTVITLTTGRRLVVKEPVDVLVERVVAYRRRILAGVGRDEPAGQGAGGGGGPVAGHRPEAAMAPAAAGSGAAGPPPNAGPSRADAGWEDGDAR
ncbi:MAG TPA: flagellar FlbD family protein [Thermaerobacter sp.]